MESATTAEVPGGRLSLQVTPLTRARLGQPVVDGGMHRAEKIVVLATLHLDDALAGGVGLRCNGAMRSASLRLDRPRHPPDNVPNIVRDEQPAGGRINDLDSRRIDAVQRGGLRNGQGNPDRCHDLMVS